MHDTAFHLVDHVLPEAPYRQYVLSYPFPVRLALARNWAAAASSRRMFLEEVFRFQRRKARQAGATKPKTGAISFTQRFGSKLNAHLHHHAVLPDGAFASLDGGAARFVRIAAPTLEELERILERVIRRTTRMLVSRGLLEEPDSEDALAHLQAESLQAGLPWPLEKQRSSSRLAVQLDGYSLEAGTHAHEHDRLALLHLCRYGLRAPFSQERLRVTDDGRVELELRRPAHDGTRVVSFTPSQFLRRLAAIVPPPRAHLTGYHGVFAARSRLRDAVAPKPKEPAGTMSPLPSPKESDRTNRTPWAHLLRRVFDHDVLTCDKCGGRREVRAFVSSPALARKALEDLGVAFEPLKIAKGHDPPSQESLDFGPRFDGVDGIDPSHPYWPLPSASRARSPPDVLGPVYLQSALGLGEPLPAGHVMAQPALRRDSDGAGWIAPGPNGAFGCPSVKRPPFQATVADWASFLRSQLGA